MLFVSLLPLMLVK